MIDDADDIAALIGQGESLTLEFKSDRNRLPDHDLVKAAASLANTEGGDLLLGVEDDGAITGLCAARVDAAGIPPLIANRTNPALSVRAIICGRRGRTIARIMVPKARQLISTSDGLLIRRRLKLDGKPEMVPIYPHEIIQRQSSMGLVDPSAMPLEEIRPDQLDPMQRLRIRKAIQSYGGDSSLTPLADEELDGALGLVVNRHGMLCPTVTGLLLLGDDDLLRRHLPTHEVAFQAFQGTDVRVNEFRRKPLLEIFEWIESQFLPWRVEEEIQIGMFRVSAPNYDRLAFREAFVNALVHRDFSALGAVHVKLDDEGLAISNPGGFVEGVGLSNLLTTPPRPRNPLLADAIKRIGLAERTGRGIDRIYEGVLRYGRPAPDYTASTPQTVSVRLSNAAADFNFMKMIISREEKSGGLPIDSLIILSRLRGERRLTAADLASSVQKSESSVRISLEKLMEAGFLESRGTGRGRSYTISIAQYQKDGKKSEYIRPIGFTPIQREQMVLAYIEERGKAKRSDIMDLCRLSGAEAYKLLKTLLNKGLVKKSGEKKGVIYTI